MQQRQSPADAGATVTVEELFERHAASIFTYLCQHVRSREDAEDILVDTFLAAMQDRKFAQLSEPLRVAWLWRVARNKTVDIFRHTARRHATSLEQVDEVIAGEQDHDPELMALRQDEMQELHEVLHRLPAEQQDLLRLRFGYGLRCAEIAAILGKREQAVRSMLSRTLNLLRTMYAQQ